MSSARVTSAQRLLLLVEREQVVERVGAAVGRQLHLGADHDAGLVADHLVRRRRCVRSRCRSRRCRRRSRRSASSRRRRDAGRVEDLLAEVGAAVGDPAARCPAGPATTTSYPRVAPRWMISVDQLAPLRGRVGGLSRTRRRAARWPPAISSATSAMTASTRWSSRPSRVCCSSTSRPPLIDDAPRAARCWPRPGPGSTGARTSARGGRPAGDGAARGRASIGSVPTRCPAL